MKTLIVGGGGRESAIAMRLAEHSAVYAISGHRNPSLVRYTEASRGKLWIAQSPSPEEIAAYAAGQAVDLAFISADEPLAAGVVDALLAAGVKTVGPSREGARIEWDKRYALEMMRDIHPRETPRFWTVSNKDELARAVAQIRPMTFDIVVKPQGLSGGKGVKVMGEHLSSLDAAADYAANLLDSRPGEAVLLVEKIEGIEFTVMAFTDGKSVCISPPTYDHPYRFEGDKGPGTGGMGAFNTAEFLLPFLSEADYRVCEEILIDVIERLRAEGKLFNGVLNGGFFATGCGIKFMEFNARLGDPEGMNIMSILDTPLTGILESIASGNLCGIEFLPKASVTKYLVSPDYALRSGPSRQYSFDLEVAEKMGVHAFFSASVACNDRSGQYRTVGNSRCLALASVGGSVPEATESVEKALAASIQGPLEWRSDIGTENYLAGLMC